MSSKLKTMKLECKDYEVVTNMPSSDVDEALGLGFIPVDASTWKPVPYKKEELADLFFNGYIDLIKKIS